MDSKDSPLCSACSQIDLAALFAPETVSVTDAGDPANSIKVVREFQVDGSLESSDQVTTTCPLCRLLQTVVLDGARVSQDLEHPTWKHLAADWYGDDPPACYLVAVPARAVYQVSRSSLPTAREDGAGDRDTVVLAVMYGLVGNPDVTDFSNTLPRAKLDGLFVSLVDSRFPQPDGLLRGRQVSSARIDFGLVSRWIELCDNNHEACRPPSKEPIGHMKLIDCRTRRIVAASPEMEYVALSYCWGLPHDAEKQCKTERHSLHTWNKNIPEQYLSPVVRDAVKTTRRLNIRYLWVDSLCITQDDIDDWRTESPLMGPIYSNAYITIIALNSLTCQQGFLEYGGEVGFENETSTSPHTTDAHGKLYRDWIHCAKNKKGRGWSSRGWTFQEEKLSKRMFYVGPSRSYFGCGNYILAEDDPIWAPVHEASVVDVASKHPPRSPEAIETLMHFWRKHMVLQFSSRQFTRPQDRLQAIASVAELIGESTGFGYVAGLWIQRLHLHLIWTDAPIKATLPGLVDMLKPDAPGFVAPSWSWARFGASHQLRFYFSQRDEWRLKPVAQLEAHHVETVGSSQYGQVRKGCLQSKTKTLTIPSGCDMSNKTRRRSGGIFLFDWIYEYSELKSGPDLEMVFIGSYLKGKKPEKWGYGIIAFPTDSASSTAYYRVGIFECSIGPGSQFYEFETIQPRTIILV